MRSSILLLCGAVSLTLVGCSRESDSERASIQKGIIYSGGTGAPSVPAPAPESDPRRFTPPAPLAVIVASTPGVEIASPQGTTGAQSHPSQIAAPAVQGGIQSLRASKTARGWVVELTHMISDHSGMNIRFCDPELPDRCTTPIVLCEEQSSGDASSSGCRPRFPLLGARIDSGAHAIAHTRFILCPQLLPRDIPENFRLELSRTPSISAEGNEGQTSTFMISQPFSESVTLPEIDVCSRSQ